MRGRSYISPISALFPGQSRSNHARTVEYTAYPRIQPRLSPIIRSHAPTTQPLTPPISSRSTHTIFTASAVLRTELARSQYRRVYRSVVVGVVVALSSLLCRRWWSICSYPRPTSIFLRGVVGEKYTASVGGHSGRRPRGSVSPSPPSLSLVSLCLSLSSSLWSLCGSSVSSLCRRR